MKSPLEQMGIPPYRWMLEVEGELLTAEKAAEKFGKSKRSLVKYLHRNFCQKDTVYRMSKEGKLLD